MKLKVCPVKPNTRPKDMSTEDLRSYLQWSAHYLAWCRNYEGREFLYNRMLKNSKSHIEELAKRNQSKKGFK